jgi:hypothetical protein
MNVTKRNVKMLNKSIVSRRRYLNEAVILRKRSSRKYSMEGTAKTTTMLREEEKVSLIE